MKIRPHILIAGFLAGFFLAGFPADRAAAQSLWNDHGPNANLIGDNIANKRGDILTIIIQESQKIQDTQEVKLEKESTLDSVLNSFNIKANTFNTLPDMKQATSRDFEGKSDYGKEGSFEARITVTVLDVMPNGNLVIEGHRNIFMDDEEKSIKITGVVRPLDISTFNTVPSEKVSDARVSYDGEGTLSRTTERGWLDSFFDFIWPF
ncbi:MAG: flagellar basal body L-ring protein FlgH [Planctomycetes bacterium]|nr:flagellar basal body L-ring protein FlgH [Planctomycetota bacterium]